MAFIDRKAANKERNVDILFANHIPSNVNPIPEFACLGADINNSCSLKLLTVNSRFSLSPNEFKEKRSWAAGCCKSRLRA